MTRRRPKASPKPGADEASPGEFEISEEEQWRLIQESGILQTVDAHPNKSKVEQVDEADEQDEPLEERNTTIDLLEEMFDTVLYLIPFSCLYVGMDIMIKQQYAQHPSFKEELGQLTTAVPILALFIFYTNRYKHTVLMQSSMAVASVASGCRMIYLVNKSPWGDVIRQCPPLGVIWVYTIVQLHLAYACLTLLGVYIFVRHYSLKIIF